MHSEHAPTGQHPDPIDVILRQDRAFGPDTVDYDLWLTTLMDPVRLLASNDLAGRMMDHAAAIKQLKTIETAARADGVAQLRTRILTHIQPAEDLAIVASMRDLLSENNMVLRTTSMTWTLSRVEDVWRISQVFFEGEAYATRQGLRDS